MSCWPLNVLVSEEGDVMVVMNLKYRWERRSWLRGECACHTNLRTGVQIPKTSKSHSDWWWTVAQHSGGGDMGSSVLCTNQWLRFAHWWLFIHPNQSTGTQPPWVLVKQGSQVMTTRDGWVFTRPIIPASLCVYGAYLTLKSNCNLKLLGNIVMYTHMTILNNHLLLIPSREIKSSCGKPVQERGPQILRCRKLEVRK